MKRKLIILSLTALVSIAAIIAVIAVLHNVSIGARNVESLTSCELKDAGGKLLFKCEGETPECSIAKKFLGSLTCSGEQVYPEE